MKHRSVRHSAFAVLFASLSLLLACSKDPGAHGSRDLLNGGVPDDGVKPVPTVAPAPTPTPTVARVGVPDDGVKPVLKPAPILTGRKGVPDDSIKPAPVPTPR